MGRMSWFRTIPHEDSGREDDYYDDPDFPRSRSFWDAILAGGIALVGLFPAWAPVAYVSTQVVGAHMLAFGRAIGVLFLIFALFPGKGQHKDSKAAVTLMSIVAAIFLIWPHSGPLSAWDWTGAEEAASPGLDGTEELRVVTFNAQDSFGVAEMAELERTFGADIYVLPEVRPEQLAAAAAAHPQFAAYESRTEQTVAPTGLLIRRELGEYHYGEAVETTFGSVRVEPAQAGLPIIEGIHTAPPLPESMDAWRADLQRVMAARDVAHPQPFILAGDFNATLRHGPLAQRTQLIDAAQSCGRIVGTWPAHIAWVPRWLASPIDHILLSPGLTASDCRVERIGASDHAAFGATISSRA